ncbi:MAG: DHHA1 domain-containing protein [Thermoanaerobacteraceae bacterium]|nr:DHHA1 domain-containing protein [Thermoanaerobacteraceae bacterium]
MTEKLYYYDSYKTEFTGNVVEVRPYGEKYAAILKGTYFYPESGGQPSDIGYIGDAKVLRVAMNDKIIYHIIDKSIGTGEYQCKIDFERRFYNMQQHTGQHILSAAFVELFNASTDSFHIGEDLSHIDIDKPDLSEVDIMSVEVRANELIYNNIPVSAYIVTSEEATKLPLRKHPSVYNNIRIVEIKNYDYSPCGGTHVSNTGEVGIIKIIRWENTKNKLRIYFACGKGALLYFQEINHTIQEIANRFSTNVNDILNRISSMEQEKKNMQKNIKSLKNDLGLYIAESLYSKCEKLNAGYSFIANIFDGYDEELLRIVSAKLSQKPFTIIIIGNISDEQRFIITRSGDIDLNLKDLFIDISNYFECNGGGSNKQVQYSIKGDSEKIFSFLKEKIKKAILA